MKSHLTAASTARSAGLRTGLFARLLGVVIVAVCAGLLLAAGALAAEYRPAGNFGCSEAAPCGADTSWEPERLSVDEKTGDVFVIDKANGGVVQVFDSKGKWLSQVTGFNFGGPFTANDIAVDNSSGPNAGHVYLAVEETKTIVVIDPSKGNAVVEEGVGSDPCGVAVDSAGNPWYADYFNGLKRFNPTTGGPEGNALIAGPHPCEIDFNGVGEMLVNQYVGQVHRYTLTEPPEEKAMIESAPSVDVAVDRLTGSVFDDLGNQIGVHDEEGNLLAKIGPAGISDGTGVTVDGAAERVYVSDPNASPAVVHMYSFHPGLRVNVTGQGEVSSSPAGIACQSGESCEGSYKEGEVVTLTGTAKPGYVLAGWSGCPRTTATTCEVAVGAGLAEATAVFLKEGVEGVEGAAGAAGQNGANGAAGAQGPAGPKGAAGAAGAQGPQGVQGPAGPAGKVTCKVVQAKKKVKVTCKVAKAASASSLHWRLTRAGHAVNRGVTRNGSVRLPSLRRGHYRLYVQGQTGATVIVVR